MYKAEVFVLSFYLIKIYEIINYVQHNWKHKFSFEKKMKYC